MTVDMKRAAELILWNKRVLSVGGMWPLEPTYVHFYISYIYFITHLALGFTDLFSVFGDAKLMIENLLETSIQVMFCSKMIVLRHSKSLRKLLRYIENNSNESNYRSDAEKELYLAYNSIGRLWFKGLHYSAFATTFIYYIGPLKDIGIAAINNETLPYVLPFKTHLFFDIQNVRTYGLMYVWQLPMFYYHYCHTAAVCFIFTLVLNVTGEMSVLAHRIRNIELSNDDNMALSFRDIIKNHLQVVWQTSTIDEIFNLILLEDLLVITILFGFVVFNLLSSTGSFYEKMFLVNYCLHLLGMMLIYCINGDYIIQESTNIHKAFYECLWYDMKPRYQKNLIICLARSQEPLHLTAGRFYVFSLSRFSEILKTSMAYVTMLRRVV